MWPVIARAVGPVRGASLMWYSASSAVISASSSQMGISTATVTLSLQSMNRWRVSCLSLLLPTAGMINSAVSVAALRLLLMTMRGAFAQGGVACDARALGSSSRRKRSCGQVVGMLSKKSASRAKLASPGRLSSSELLLARASAGQVLATAMGAGIGLLGGERDAGDARMGGDILSIVCAHRITLVECTEMERSECGVRSMATAPGVRRLRRSSPSALLRTKHHTVMRMLTGPSVMVGAAALMPDAFCLIQSRATVML